IGRKVVQRAIAAIKIELDACDGHEFEAVDAETLQVVEAGNDAIESVVELCDLEFVDREIIELRRLVVGVRPCEERRVASKGQRRELPDVGCASEGIGEPESKH